MWVGALLHFPQSWNVSIPPTLLPQQTCFFILSNRFSLWRPCVCVLEGGGVHLGLKTNSLKNVGTKWKEAYSHGGSVSCHWPLWRAEIMCLWGFHKGYSFLDLGTRLKELPLARLGHPHKIISTHPSLHIFPLPLSRANSKNGAAWSAREWENKVHGV